jgi:hypothetical protein
MVQRMHTRQRAQIRWLDDHLLVFHVQRCGGEFAAKQSEFLAEHWRDYIAPSRSVDTTGGPDRVGAAASA